MMESLTNATQIAKTKKKTTVKFPKTVKNTKSSFSTKAGKILNKSKTVKSGEKSDFSVLNSAKSNTSKLSKKTPTAEKVSSLLSQVSVLKTSENPKNRCFSGHSFRRIKKKENFLAHGLKEKKFLLKGKVLSGLNFNHEEKSTPRPAYPSPAVRTELMWTPEQVKGAPSKSTISDKKKKRPEIGYYIKRFSLHDVNKTLYSDQDISKISFDTPKKLPSEISFIEPQANISEIMKISTPPKNPQDSQIDFSFQSPTRLLRVFSSPEKLKVSPEFKLEEPKAPRKTLAGFESPGSFNFSISSSSSLEESRENFQVRNSECQTDLVEVDEEDMRKGLVLLGKLLRATT